MESQFQKWVYVSYLVAAVLLGYLVFSAGHWSVGYFDLETSIRNVDWVIRGSSLFVGFLLFFLLYRSDQANQFMNEVIVELSRVSWPTQKETSNSTLLVVIMVLVCGVVLAIMDYLWTTLIQWIL